MIECKGCKIKIKEGPRTIKKEYKMNVECSVCVLINYFLSGCLFVLLLLGRAPVAFVRSVTWVRVVDIWYKF